MTRQDNDDVGSLFKSIGAKNKQFKEFDTENNAAQAQERWPLFKTLDLEKRSPPPQLQSSEKKIWEKTAAAPAPIKPTSKKTAPSLGKQIAKGLRSMVPAAAAATPFAHRLAPISAPEEEIAAPALKLGKARNAFAMPPVAAPAHIAPAHIAPTHAAPAHSAPRGLFAKAKPEAAPAIATRPTAPTVPTVPGAPRGLFAKAPPASAPEAAQPKKSLFGKASQSDVAAVTNVNNVTNATNATNTGESNQPTNKLASLFARLEQPEPEPAKGLFGRKRKP